MITENKNRITIARITANFLVFIALLLPALKSSAQDEKKATMTLSFIRQDSVKLCNATVLSDKIPVKGTDVHFYIKRSFSLLPVGKAIETDENGEASVNLPMDIPGDQNGNVIVVAKIEDDDNFGNVETSAGIKWDVLPDKHNDTWGSRSLSASREKAPMFLIIASNLIIAVIWGTIFYVVLQIFRIRKESQLLKKKN